MAAIASMPVGGSRGDLPALQGLPMDVALETDPDGQERYDGQVVVRALLQRPRDMMLMQQLSDDAWTHGPRLGDWSDWRLRRQDMDALRAAGIAFDILIPDLQPLVLAERERLARSATAQAKMGESWFADFKNLAQINARLDELVAARPDLCSIVTAGSSIEGRPIRGIRISKHAPGTQVPGFVFTATQHAREWAVPMAAMWFADQLVERHGLDTRLTAIVDRSEVFIFPVMNPDGYQHSWTSSRLWRKNRRLNSGGSYGVDLNRNWGAGWGGSGSSGTQSSDTYRGTAAFSEPETAGFRNWATPRSNLAGHIDLHSYSQLILWPYSYQSALPPDTAAYQRVATAMQNGVKSVNNRTYQSGNSWSTYGATAGCAEDWTYNTVGSMGFCVEVRDTGSYGFVMPASEILPNAKENLAGAVGMMEELLASASITLLQGPGEEIEPGVSSTVRATVTANVGNLLTNGVRLSYRKNNGPVNYALMTQVSGAWQGTLPALACDDRLAWSIEAEATFALTRWPQNLPDAARVTDVPCGVPGDLDGNGIVDAGDVGLLLLQFGACTGCSGDLDGNGTVDAGDLGLLLLQYS
jgi:murein tripeptide amidase MpaA